MVDIDLVELIGIILCTVIFIIGFVLGAECADKSATHICPYCKKDISKSVDE